MLPLNGFMKRSKGFLNTWENNFFNHRDKFIKCALTRNKISKNLYKSRYDNGQSYFSVFCLSVDLKTVTTI